MFIGILTKTLIIIGGAVGTGLLVYILVFHLLIVAPNVQPPGGGMGPMPTSTASPGDSTPTDTPTPLVCMSPGTAGSGYCNDLLTATATAGETPIVTPSPDVRQTPGSGS